MHTDSDVRVSVYVDKRISTRVNPPLSDLSYLINP